MANETQAEARQSAPSTVRTVPDLHQVMVDQWGHRGEFIRGQIVNINDLDPAHYDHEHAVRVGVLRPLSEAEARSWPTTTPVNDDGSLDEDHQRAMQYAAGITPALPRTVTTEQGPAEPAEFSKPTVPYTGDNAPSPRPIVTGTALEAETEGARATRTEITPSGTAYARREDFDENGRPRTGRRRASEASAPSAPSENTAG